MAWLLQLSEKKSWFPENLCQAYIPVLFRYSEVVSILIMGEPNTPFPSYLVPLFQNESSCKTFQMEMSLINFYENEPLRGSISLWMVSHEDSFWNRGKMQLGNGQLFEPPRETKISLKNHAVSREIGGKITVFDWGERNDFWLVLARVMIWRFENSRNWDFTVFTAIVIYFIEERWSNYSLSFDLIFQ